MKKVNRAVKIQSPAPRIPPDRDRLREQGKCLRIMKRLGTTDDAQAALKRARALPWGSTILEERPYWTGPWWVWVCKSGKVEVSR